MLMSNISREDLSLITMATSSGTGINILTSSLYTTSKKWILVGILVMMSIPVQVESAFEDVCKRPDEADYHMNVTLGRPGPVVSVECKEGNEGERHTITCLNRQWTKPDPPCKLPECPTPEYPGPPMIIQVSCRYYNCTASYSCTEGYWYNGTTHIVCQRDNTWTHPVGTCQAVVCPKLDAPKNGKVLQEDRSYGGIVTTVCDEGFILSDRKAAKRTCRGDNTWSGKDIVCEVVNCTELIEPKHGRILQSDRLYKSKAITICDDGYVPSDPDATTRYCQADNNWGGKAVNCTKKLCPKLQDVENGMLSALSGMFEDKVTLQCTSGYMLDGAHTITCEASGEWNAKMGNCIHDKNLTLIISLVVACCATIAVILVIVYLMRKRFATRFEPQSEMQPLLDKQKCHFTFVLGGDFGDALPDAAGKESFIKNLQKSIEVATKKLVTSVEVLYFCHTANRGFLSLRSKASVPEQKLKHAVSESEIAVRRKTETLTFSIIPASIVAMDMVQSTLSAEILRVKHNRDRDMDDIIDFKTQYVKLKLQSHETIGAMQRDEIERPDYYQDGLKQDGGTDIEDEDLVSSNDFQKFVMIRGRAGIGKSTLNQRILWKWAKGEWATQFKAIFLLSLRYLMTVEDTMDFLVLLNMYSVYKIRRTDTAVTQCWLDENEMRIMFVLDGLDEVDFSGFVKKKSKNLLTPLEWCFALMRKDLLEASTLIVSSRPFAELGEIALTLKERALSDTLRLVQLVGLTRERVHDFVNKNVREERRDFVWQTLVKNPILMSISSITFYCAALCKILGQWTDKEPGLKTYTQITAYIMKSFIQRSMLKAESTLKEQEVLEVLAKSAFHGLSQEIGKRPLRLIFDSTDLENLSTKKEIIRLMLQTGLLVQTEIPDPEDKDRCTVLNQFVHLLIQEFLAMVGLLACSVDEFKEVLNKLGKTQQFSMATLFLFGLAFNHDDDMIQQVSTVKDNQEDWPVKQGILKTFATKSSDIEAAQIAHESQSADVARVVGEHHFKDGCCFKNSKLTVIDILAITFVMKENQSIRKLSLERAELDSISIQELSKFLKNENTVEEIVLVDDTLDDDCVKEFTSAVGVDKTLRSIKLASDSMTDLVMVSIADLISGSETLLELELLGAAVTDTGIMSLAKALESNKSLKSLSITFRKMTDKGIHCMAQALGGNTTLKELCVNQPDATDKEIIALGQAVCSSNSITTFRIDCSKITDDVVKHISKSLTQNTCLTELWLHSRHLTDTGVEHLMQALTSQSTLTHITLIGFYMKGVGINAILQTKEVSPNTTIYCWKPDVDDGLLESAQSDGRIKFIE